MSSKSKIKVQADVDGYFSNMCTLLAALGKHLEVLDDMEFTGVQKFTVAGLALGVSTKLNEVINKLKEWEIFPDA